MKRPIAATLALALTLLVSALLLPASLQAQDRPSERQLRTFIPPDQLVSFVPSTPFDQFIAFINPIFERVTGKTIVDPQDRTSPIGVSISGMYFFDAFELVASYNGLAYQETDDFFVLEPAPVEEGAAVAEDGAAPAQQEGPLATIGTREIAIDAVLFDLNLTKARQLGIDWNVLFGEASGGGQGGGGGGGGQGGDSRPRFFVETDELFDDLDYVTGPSRVELSTLTRLFRLLENEGIGQTIANPTIKVQSGEVGRIQIGTDVPIQIRDFAGNTVTDFVSTGIIVEVTPTLLSEPLADTSGAPILDFVHLAVQVENSSSSPSPAGPIIDQNTANTQVLLLDGEQTVIGGLYSTEETINRRGIPVLKDLPPWFFGLRYVFGYEQKSITQRELLIVLKAEVVEPLRVRARFPYEGDLIQERRERARETIRGLGEEAIELFRLPSEGSGQ